MNYRKKQLESGIITKAEYDFYSNMEREAKIGEFNFVMSNGFQFITPDQRDRLIEAFPHPNEREQNET